MIILTKTDKIYGFRPTNFMIIAIVSLFQASRLCDNCDCFRRPSSSLHQQTLAAMWAQTWPLTVKREASLLQPFLGRQVPKTISWQVHNSLETSYKSDQETWHDRPNDNILDHHIHGLWWCNGGGGDTIESAVLDKTWQYFWRWWRFKMTMWRDLQIWSWCW